MAPTPSCCLSECSDLGEIRVLVCLTSIMCRLATARSLYNTMAKQLVRACALHSVSPRSPPHFL